MGDSNDKPCLSGGAGCKSFRVAFYRAEAGLRGLPAHLTEQVNPHYLCTAGTNAREPHCAALQGPPGGPVACSIYEHPPNPAAKSGSATTNACAHGRATACRRCLPIDKPACSPRNCGTM